MSPAAGTRGDRLHSRQLGGGGHQLRQRSRLLEAGQGDDRRVGLRVELRLREERLRQLRIEMGGRRGRGDQAGPLLWNAALDRDAERVDEAETSSTECRRGLHARAKRKAEGVDLHPVASCPASEGRFFIIGRLLRLRSQPMVPSARMRARAWISFCDSTTVAGRTRSMIERTNGRIEGLVSRQGISPSCASRS